METFGARFIAENASSGERTRHTNVKYHFIKEHSDVGLIKSVQVNTGDSNALVFTRDVGKIGTTLCCITSSFFQSFIRLVTLHCLVFCKSVLV
jgi:hypothetical protein